MLRRVTNFVFFQVFTSEEEEALVGYIRKCCAYYHGLSIDELKRLAYQFAKKIMVRYPNQWNDNGMAGRGWYRHFMKRHYDLVLRSPELTSLHRIKAFCKENVELFFTNLDSVLGEITFQPSAIWNMDETRFSTVPTKIGKVLAEKGSKRVGQIASQKRGSMENASVGAVGYANDSGWMTRDDFVKFIYVAFYRS